MSLYLLISITVFCVGMLLYSAWRIDRDNREAARQEPRPPRAVFDHEHYSLVGRMLR